MTCRLEVLSSSYETTKESSYSNFNINLRLHQGNLQGKETIKISLQGCNIAQGRTMGLGCAEVGDVEFTHRKYPKMELCLHEKPLLGFEISVFYQQSER